MATLREQISGVLRVSPDADAVEFEKRWRSWGELHHAMQELDRLLNDAGLGAGARVAVVLRNGRQALDCSVGKWGLHGC